VLWGISTEWWILYLLIFVFSVSICILLGLITTVLFSACKAAEECAIRSLDISNIYKIILEKRGDVEASKSHRNEVQESILDYKDNINDKFVELEKLLSRIVSTLEADQVSRDGISKAVSDINSKIQSGIQFKLF
jgi:hypothetical protein